MNIAEVSYLVRDDDRHRRFGPFLDRTLARIARENGVAGLDAKIRPDNSAMMKVPQWLGYPVATAVTAGN